MLNEAICAADAASCRKFFLLLNIYCDPQPPTPPFSPHMSQYLLQPPHPLHHLLVPICLNIYCDPLTPLHHPPVPILES